MSGISIPKKKLLTLEGCLAKEFEREGLRNLNNVFFFFLVFMIYVWTIKCVKIFVSVFKMLKSMFEMTY